MAYFGSSIKDKSILKEVLPNCRTNPSKFNPISGSISKRKKESHSKKSKSAKLDHCYISASGRLVETNKLDIKKEQTRPINYISISF